MKTAEKLGEKLRGGVMIDRFHNILIFLVSVAVGFFASSWIAFFVFFLFCYVSSRYHATVDIYNCTFRLTVSFVTYNLIGLFYPAWVSMIVSLSVLMVAFHEYYHKTNAEETIFSKFGLRVSRKMYTFSFFIFGAILFVAMSLNDLIGVKESEFDENTSSSSYSKKSIYMTDNQVCRYAISAEFGQAVETMMGIGLNVSYYSKENEKTYSYQCKIDRGEQSVVWRLLMDNGRWGRWRNGPYDQPVKYTFADDNTVVFNALGNSVTYHP